MQTVKGVAFCGANDEFVMSGSDCGNMFIWDKVGPLTMSSTQVSSSSWC